MFPPFRQKKSQDNGVFYHIPQVSSRNKKLFLNVHGKCSMHYVTALCAALALGCASLAHAQSFPVKPVRVISPYAPGGLGDLLPRAVAAGLTELIGQQVI